MELALILEWIIKAVILILVLLSPVLLILPSTSAKPWPASRCVLAPTGPVRGACCSR